jgi:hypothetical protein
MSKENSEALLRVLMREFFQTETSAVQHCRREALRYGDAPPAAALRAVADDASQVLRKLPALAETAGLPVSKLGVLTGALFSEVRDKVLDRLVQAERSYRGTLLGVRHGVDLVYSLRHVAETMGNEPVFDFCEGWLTRRIVLMDRVEEELVWLARHPEKALHSSKPSVPWPHKATPSQPN